MLTRFIKWLAYQLNEFITGFYQGRRIPHTMPEQVPYHEAAWGILMDPDNEDNVPLDLP